MKPTHDKLTPVDTAWFRMEAPGNSVDIAALMLFEGELDQERLLRVIAERLRRHRRFCCRVRERRLGLGLPRWEPEPDGSFERHLGRVVLPDPGGEPELAALVGQMMSEPLDFAISPWRVWRIDGFEGGTALFAQIHHCMGDGFALMQVLLDLADGAKPPPASPSESRSRHRIANLAGLGGDSARALGHLLLLPFDPPSCLRGKLGGQRRAAFSRPIPLAHVRQLGRERGATVNDVLMSALSGALRRHLELEGEHPDALSLRAIVPVNLRPPDEPLDLDHGNWFGLVFVDLPVQVRDPELRARELKVTLDRIKQSSEAAVSLGVLDGLGLAPPTLERVLDDTFARKASLVVTNVPGPREQLSLAGIPLGDLVFWVPHPGRLALGVSIVSYAGTLRVGVRSDARVVAAPERLVELFEQELASFGLGATAPDPRATPNAT